MEWSRNNIMNKDREALMRFFKDDERDLQRLVDRVIEHHVSELEKQTGPDDEFVKYMRSTRMTALILPFPIRGQTAE